MKRRRGARRLAPRDSLSPAWFAAPPIAAMVSHATALGAGFVWLDHAHLEAGLGIARPAGWFGLFTRGFAGTGYYRPLTALSLSIDALSGQPWLYHAVTVAWHAAAALALAFAASALGSARRAAVLAGVLFAVHPSSSLVADAIAFRSEAMLATLLFALVAAHVHRRPVLAACAMLAAGLTKETGLVLGPLFVIALEATRSSGGGARSRSSAERPRRVLAAEGASFAVALGLRMAFAPAWRAEHLHLTASEALGTRLASLTEAARAVLAPVDLRICDAFAITPWTTPARSPARRSPSSWDGSHGGVEAQPCCSPSPPYRSCSSSRFSAGGHRTMPTWRSRSSACSWRTRLRLPPSPSVAVRRGGRRHPPVRSRDVRGSTTLRERRVALAAGGDAQPACREGQFLLGESARARRDWSEAAARYEAALGTWPRVLAYVDRAAALQNLGTVRLEQDDLTGARRAFEDALDVTPEPMARRRLVHDLAGVALRAGDPAECWRLLEPEVARTDAFPESLYIAAKALHALHREAETRALIQRLQRMGWTGKWGLGAEGLRG